MTPINARGDSAGSELALVPDFGVAHAEGVSTTDECGGAAMGAATADARTAGALGGVVDESAYLSLGTGGNAWPSAASVDPTPKPLRAEPINTSPLMEPRITSAEACCDRAIGSSGEESPAGASAAHAGTAMAGTNSESGERPTSATTDDGIVEDTVAGVCVISSTVGGVICTIGASDTHAGVPAVVAELGSGENTLAINTFGADAEEGVTVGSWLKTVESGFAQSEFKAIPRLASSCLDDVSLPSS